MMEGPWLAPYFCNDALADDEVRFQSLRQFAVGQDPALTLPVWERCLLFFAAVAARAKSTELGGGEDRSLALQTLSAEFGNLREMTADPGALIGPVFAFVAD